MNKQSYISGIGYNLPDKIMKNDELSKYMDTSDQWIQERSETSRSSQFLKDWRYLGEMRPLKFNGNLTGNQVNLKST